MSTTWIRVAYGLVLGVVLAVTAGFGVLVFESGPKPPQPLGLSFSQLSGNSTQAESTRIQKQIDSFYSDNQAYREKYPAHQRNIFLWFAGLGLFLAAVGVGLPAIVNYLRLGFVLSGVILVVAGTWFALRVVPQVAPASAASLLSLLPSGEPSNLDTAGRFLRFAVVLVGMLVLLFIGLWRLTEWPTASTATRRDAAGASTSAMAVAPTSGTSPPPADGDTARTVPMTPAPGERLKWARPDESPTPSEAGPPQSAAEGALPPVTAEATAPPTNPARSEATVDDAGESKPIVD